LLAGVKQSGGEFDYHRALVQLAHQKNFVVLTGADTQIVDAMSLGAAGCVSGLANAVPELVVAVYEAVRAQHSRQTETASKRMSSVGELVEKLEFPLNVRAAMEARGLPVGAPKSIVSSSTQSRYEELVGDLKEVFRQWNLI
jgi:4-hydroxy-tetrahydrodipicolinate synthase